MTGTQIDWCTDAFWCDWYTGGLVYLYTDMQVDWYTGIFVKHFHSVINLILFIYFVIISSFVYNFAIIYFVYLSVIILSCL